MIGGWVIHGHAIVSADDRIADASGWAPPSLRNEADWIRFQAALDAAAVSVLGHRGHRANPNVKKRNRLVLSAGVRGTERRDDAWWWNPAETPVADALALAAPKGGSVAVTGGRRVFDLFLEVGFDAFFLAKVEPVVLADGVPIFSAVGRGLDAAQVLAATLTMTESEILDRKAGVSLSTWRRPA